MNGCHSGHLRLRSERNLAYPAGAQEGRHQGFHPLVNHPFPIIARRKSERRDRSEKKERQSGYRSVSFSAFAQFTDSVLLHRPEGLRKRDITVSRNSFTRYYAQHLRIIPTRSLPSQLFTLSAIFHSPFSILNSAHRNRQSKFPQKQGPSAFHGPDPAVYLIYFRESIAACACATNRS